MFEFSYTIGIFPLMDGDEFLLPASVNHYSDVSTMILPYVIFLPVGKLTVWLRGKRQA